MVVSTVAIIRVRRIILTFSAYEEQNITSHLADKNQARESFRKSIGGKWVYLKPGSIPTIFSFNKEKPSKKVLLYKPQSTSKQTCSSHADLELSHTETRDDIERDIHSSPLENANENNSFEEPVDEESQPLEH